MAWKAPTAPKHTDLGEIPGIRELSDEERATLEAADPNGGVHAIGRNLEKSRDAKAEELVNDYGQLAMDVAGFIDEWIDCEEDATRPFDIMSTTLHRDIKERLQETKDTYQITEVYDIACRRMLLPMMFYFGVNVDSTTGEVFAIVTRDDWWDENKILDSDSLSRFVVPECLSNPMDSRYDVDPGMTPSAVRKELKKNGFVENHEVAGL